MSEIWGSEVNEIPGFDIIAHGLQIFKNAEALHGS